MKQLAKHELKEKGRYLLQGEPKKDDHNKEKYCGCGPRFSFPPREGEVMLFGILKIEEPFYIIDTGHCQQIVELPEAVYYEPSEPFSDKARAACY